MVNHEVYCLLVNFIGGVTINLHQTRVPPSPPNPPCATASQALHRVPRATLSTNTRYPFQRCPVSTFPSKSLSSLPSSKKKKKKKREWFSILSSVIVKHAPLSNYAGNVIFINCLIVAIDSAPIFQLSIHRITSHTTFRAAFSLSFC
jgi:hypothetical protein